VAASLDVDRRRLDWRRRDDWGSHPQLANLRELCADLDREGAWPIVAPRPTSRAVAIAPDEAAQALTAAELAAVADHLETGIAEANPQKAKALLRLLIHELRVTAEPRSCPPTGSSRPRFAQCPKEWAVPSIARTASIWSSPALYSESDVVRDERRRGRSSQRRL
jgi:hypothetical protein